MSLRPSSALLVVVVGAAIAAGTLDHERASAPQVASAPTTSADPRAEIERCDERVRLAPLRDVRGLAWSPDSRLLAMQRDLSDGGLGRLVERRVLILAIEDGSLRDVGAGIAPTWSGSGSLLSYWSVNGDEAIVWDAIRGALVARVAPSTSWIGWRGEALLYWRGTALRQWSTTGDREVLRLDASLVPGESSRSMSLSADGERFALLEWSDRGTLVAVRLGSTSTGALEMRQEGASPLIWAPSGHAYAIVTDAIVEVVDESGRRSATRLGEDERLAMWGPDGRSVALRPRSGGGRYGEIDYVRLRVSDGTGSDRELTVPDLRGAMSPDARHYAGTRPADWHGGTWLEIFRCSAGKHLAGSAANWMGSSLEEGGYRVTIHVMQGQEFDVPSLGGHRLSDWGWSCAIDRVGEVAGGGLAWSGVGDELRAKAPAPTSSVVIGARIASERPLPEDAVELFCGVRDPAGTHGARLRLAYERAGDDVLVRGSSLAPW